MCKGCSIYSEHLRESIYKQCNIEIKKIATNSLPFSRSSGNNRF